MSLYCSCVICKSNVATSQLSKHYGSKLCLSGGKYVPMLECPYCSKTKDDMIEDFANHVKYCDLNPNRNFYKNSGGKSYAEGRVAWNKGQRSKPDTRNPDYVGKHGGYRENAGISKKFKVSDSFGKETTLQSTYELKCSGILNELGIKWIRPKALKYDNKNYFADFYLPDFDLYLDPKNNYKATLDKDKIEKVIQQNKVKVLILLEDQLTQEYIASITQLV